MSNWIDFKELRSRLDFEQVLKHYGVEVRRKGDQHMGFCPLPDHQGKRNSPSFSANLTRGIFKCFGCGASGNILEFAARMEKTSVNDGRSLRTVALKLRDLFCPEGHSDLSGSKILSSKQGTSPKSTDKKPILVNAPLDFELKDLDQGHPYLLGRGFTSETIKLFGIGFCSRGAMKGRVAIPLHDSKEKLIGYAGRIVDDAGVSEENPKYRLPSKRTRGGKTFEFRKGRFLYNAFRIAAPVEDLIVVEGFTSVWWLTQNGFPNVVAIMGSDCSERQAECIVALIKPKGQVWIIPDGDAAGKRCAESLLMQISPHRFVRWVKLPEGTQPTEYSSSALAHLFE